MAQLTTDASRKSAAFQIMFVLIGALAILLRIMAKQIRERPFMSHDYMAMFSFLCMVGYATAICVATFHGGLGVHIETLMAQPDGPEKVILFLKSFFASEWFYAFATTSVRWAIVLLYVNVFERRWLKLGSYVTAGLITVAHVGFIITVISYCRPIQYSWDRSIPGGHCGNTLSLELASGAINLAMDFVLIILPMPVIWKLQMPFKKKAIVTSVFSIGFINVGINIGRILEPLVTNFEDFSYSTVDAAILITAELLTALLVACIPTLGPVFSPAKFRSKYYANGWNSCRRPKGLAQTTIGGEAGYSDRSHSTNNANFTKLDEDSVNLCDEPVELQNLQQSHGGDVSAYSNARASNLSYPGQIQQPRGIGVRRDLEVTASPRARELV